MFQGASYKLGMRTSTSSADIMRCHTKRMGSPSLDMVSSLLGVCSDLLPVKIMTN